MHCNDKSQVVATFNGSNQWVVVRERDWKVLPPQIATRVFSRQGGLPRPVAEHGGPFQIELSSSNGFAMWSGASALKGNDAGATGWSYSGSRGSHESKLVLRRGSIGAAAVRALWTDLEKLHWEALPDVRAMATDTTGTSLYLQRGGATVDVVSEGGCNCYYQRPDQEQQACACPTAEAMDNVEAVAAKLPAVEWTTRVTGEKSTTRRYELPSLAVLEGGVKCDPSSRDLASDVIRYRGGQVLGCSDGSVVTEFLSSGAKWLALRRDRAGETRPVPVQQVSFVPAKEPARRPRIEFRGE
jgi:hypothetical protein